MQRILVGIFSCEYYVMLHYTSDPRIYANKNCGSNGKNHTRDFSG